MCENLTKAAMIKEFNTTLKFYGCETVCGWRVWALDKAAIKRIYDAVQLWRSDPLYLQVQVLESHIAWELELEER
jgi:hypothetical protein